MPKSLIVKKCSTCKKKFPLRFFSKNRTTKDGFQAECKFCHKKYMNKYKKSKRVVLLFRKYRNEYNKRNPKIRRAQQELWHIILDGKIKRAPSYHCRASLLCFKRATEYHHHLGYNKNHRLDVIPVCRKCHINFHLKGLPE
jgi:hypothetical protein